MKAETWAITPLTIATQWSCHSAMLEMFKKRQDLDFAAAVMDETGWRLVGIAYKNAAKPEMLVCEFLDKSLFSEESKHIARLRSKMREYRLDKKGLSTCLGLGEYTLVSMEAPQVPVNEMRAAVRWQVQDLIDFHIDDAVVDVFDAPTLTHSQQHTIYAVISKKKVLEKRVATLQEIDANLTVVDIPELILRNVAALMDENDAGMVMLYFTESMGLLTLIQDNTLYLARTLDIGHNDLARASADGGGESIEQLCLEIQRSLDYFDRYFGRSPIQHILVAPMQDICPNLVDLIQQQLGLSVRYFSLDEIVTFRQYPLGIEQQRKFLIALGAALRQEHSTL